ncbi:MAG: aspartyl protease family protein [Candidatus Eremiobacteraeota bacterium]|nr:aspartyl protease family protein [Candidatus Eremiobacteraeota bacterium]
MTSLRSLTIGLVAALAVLGCGSSAKAASPAQRVDELLHASRVALGGSSLAHIKVLRLDQRIQSSGLTGSGVEWLEFGGARFAERSVLPPTDTWDGFDGQQSWNRDGSGLVSLDGGLVGRALEITAAFISNDTLWSKRRGNAAVRWGGVRNEKGHAYDVLVITPPQSALPFEFWFDNKTHLAQRSVQTAGPLTTTTTYSDYRSVAGVKIPYHLHQYSSDGNAADTTVVRATVNPNNGSSFLKRPRSDVHDFSISGGASEASIPIDLVENHVYLSVMLNGKGPYRFIFDTGGANIVDPAVAQEIGAAGHGTMQASGAGSGTESVSFATIRTLAIGNAIVRDQLFGVAPVRKGFGMSAGRPVDGLIGFEVLSRFVTTFDYANNRVILQMHPTKSAAPGAAVVPFVLDARQPQFACTIAAIPTQCTLDTGARDSMTLFTPFVLAHPELAGERQTANGVGGFGFGGPALGKLTRVQSFRVGNFVIPNVIAEVSTQTQGAVTMPFLGANVGGNLLKRFTMTLDYTKQTMTLLPNASYDKPDSYERSGLFLLRRGGHIEVLDARKGTPAAEAGIIKGDVIDSADGAAVAQMSLDEVRAIFFKPAGTVVKLELTSKDGAHKTVQLRLNDYI